MRLNRDTLSTLREARLETLEPRRLMAFGQLDTSFASDGRAVVNVPPILDPSAALTDLELTDDGEIVGGGSGGLVRWEPDGSFDASFGTDGVAHLPGGTYRDHAIASDGRIFLLASSERGTTVVRHTAGGDAEGGFGGDGAEALVTSTVEFTPVALAVQEDGKVLVAGTVQSSGGKEAFSRVYRLEADGAPDLAFGNQGSVEFQLGLGTAETPRKRDAVAGLTVLSGGKIVVGGSSLAYVPEFYDDAAGVYRPAVYGDSTFTTVRLTPDGVLDVSYADGGVSRTVFTSGVVTSAATAFVHRRSDDAIAMAAYTDRLVYAQFNASGVVGFSHAAETPGFGRPLDMATKSDGRFAIVGVTDEATDNGLQVVYVNPDGLLGNIVQTNDANPVTVDLLERGPAAIAVADDGDLLIGGRPASFGGYQLVKMDDGRVDAPRPDHFVDARGNDLVRDELGGLHLAYFDATRRVLKYAYRAPGGLWRSPVVVDDAPESGHFISLAVDAGARPGIAYFDGLAGDLKYAFSPSDGDWNTQYIEQGGNVGLYPSLQFDVNSRPTVAYYKKTGGDLKLAVRMDEGWAFELIDGLDGDVGRSAQLLAQPENGRWSIAYTDTSANSVKFAWRTRQRTWQIETAAVTTGGADYLSLAYNPSTQPEGVYLHPAIGYFDAFSADMAVTQASGDGAAGAFAWTSKLLATKGVAGMYSHLTFDAFHGPTVYYFNRTSNRVVRLTDHYLDGLSGETVVAGAGRNLSVFSNGTTVDIAYFDEDEGVLKVNSMPLRV